DHRLVTQCGKDNRVGRRGLQRAGACRQGDGNLRGPEGGGTSNGGADDLDRLAIAWNHAEGHDVAWRHVGGLESYDARAVAGGSRERYIVDTSRPLGDRLSPDRGNAKRRRPGDEDGTRRVTNERRLRGAIERDGVRLDPDPARRAAVLIGPAVVSAGLAAIVVGVNASAVGIQAAVTLHACSH